MPIDALGRVPTTAGEMTVKTMMPSAVPVQDLASALTLIRTARYPVHGQMMAEWSMDTSIKAPSRSVLGRHSGASANHPVTPMPFRMVKLTMVGIWLWYILRRADTQQPDAHTPVNHPQ